MDRLHRLKTVHVHDRYGALVKWMYRILVAYNTVASVYCLAASAYLVVANATALATGRVSVASFFVSPWWVYFVAFLTVSVHYARWAQECVRFENMYQQVLRVVSTSQASYTIPAPIGIRKTLALRHTVDACEARRDAERIGTNAFTTTLLFLLHVLLKFYVGSMWFLHRVVLDPYERTVVRPYVTVGIVIACVETLMRAWM